jgi:hypothetical protein
MSGAAKVPILFIRYTNLAFQMLNKTTSRKFYRAKTPRRKEKLSTDFSELGVLCVFARVIFFRSVIQK